MINFADKLCSIHYTLFDVLNVSIRDKIFVYFNFNNFF